MAGTHLKYMGSKRAMLRNGLGALLDQTAPKAKRFVDLFAGSAVVATYVAQNHDVQVVANDLQLYSKILAAAVLSRTAPVDGRSIWEEWAKSASFGLSFEGTPPTSRLSSCVVQQHRTYARNSAVAPITRAYGGHYFSVQQALEFDAFRRCISQDPNVASLELAAMIVAASQCVAAPGHTAQPFQPSETGIIYIEEAWRRSARDRIQRALFDLSDRFAKREGYSVQGDANAFVANCSEGDLVFIDPPYSGVHYSRFYHVLETIAEGECGEVSGKGRYPNQHKRPRSNYSMKSQSLAAFEELLRAVSKRGATAIVTFPDRECSNGISGNEVREMASKYFRVAEEIIESKFSSMGGRSDGENRQAGRSARMPTDEIVFHLANAI